MKNKTSPKKLISKLMFFIPTLLLFYVISICLWGEFAPANFKGNMTYATESASNTYFTLREAELVKNTDILFLGSSRTYRGFDPRIFKRFGINTFNLGSSSQKPVQTKILLDTYLKRLNPKLVIFELSPLVFKGGGLESSIDILTNAPISKTSFKIALDNKNLLIFNCLIFQIYKYLLDKDPRLHVNPVASNDTYIGNGYVQTKLKNNHNVDNHFNMDKIDEINQVEAFEQIVSLLHKEKIKVIFVQAPTESVFYNSFKGNEKFDKQIIKYGEYYNFNKIVKLNDTLDFYDDNHLTQSGVEKFNLSLIDVMQMSRKFGK